MFLLHADTEAVATSVAVEKVLLAPDSGARRKHFQFHYNYNNNCCCDVYVPAETTLVAVELLLVLVGIEMAHRAEVATEAYPTLRTGGP